MHGQWRDLACIKKWAAVRARRFKPESEKIGGGDSVVNDGRQGIFMPGGGPMQVAGPRSDKSMQVAGPRSEKPAAPRSDTDVAHRKLIVRKNMDGHNEIAFPTLLLYRDGDIDVNTIFQKAYKANFNRHTPKMRTCVVMGTTGKPYQPMFVDMEPNPDALPFTIYNVNGVTAAVETAGITADMEMASAESAAGGDGEPAQGVAEEVMLEDAAELPSVGESRGYTHIIFEESFDRASVRMHMVSSRPPKLSLSHNLRL